MIWPFKTRTTKQIARIEIKGVINSETRKFLLEALETVKEKKFPALSKSGGYALEYASEELKEDPEIVLRGVNALTSFWNE